MKGLGAASKALFEQLKGGAPDKAVVKTQADKIAAAARTLPTWFPAGSGHEAGVKTGALPVIWSDPKGFAAAAQRLQETSARLAAAADVGDMAQVGHAAGEVGGACKGCHDKYRVKRE
jgi:cytochrome c556